MERDPEKRRQARLEKKQRAARKQALLLRLCIAAVILLLCGILIVSFAAHHRTGQSETTVPDTQPVTTAPEDVPETTAPTTVIHFAAAGDLNVNQRVVDSGGENYDYSDMLLDVAYLLADADLATVNLEGNLCGAPYGSTASAPQGLMEALSRAGVDMIQLANSYSINRGVSGLLTTMDAVRQAGMEGIGVFRDEAEYRQKKGFTMFEVSGIRVAVVGFTKGMDGTTLPPGSENCVNILYSDYDSVYQKIDREKIRTVLSAVEAEQPDITIALLHWGSEFNDTISSSQNNICELLKDCGVDAVIGTHSHYVHKMDYDEESGFFVAYSLGDFVGDAARAGSEYSVILDLEITKDNATGETKLTGYSYTPIFIVAEEDQPIRVLRIREAMAAYEAGYRDAVSKDIYESMAYALTRIEARISGE